MVVSLVLRRLINLNITWKHPIPIVHIAVYPYGRRFKMTFDPSEFDCIDEHGHDLDGIDLIVFDEEFSKLDVPLEIELEDDVPY